MAKNDSLLKKFYDAVKKVFWSSWKSNSAYFYPQEAKPCTHRIALFKVSHFSCKLMCIMQQFPVKKKTANEASKTSSAQKEASKSAVVQKGPEKAQKRKLVDSSDPVCGFTMRVTRSNIFEPTFQLTTLYKTATDTWMLDMNSHAWFATHLLLSSNPVHLTLSTPNTCCRLIPRKKKQRRKRGKPLLLERRPANPLLYKKDRRKHRSASWSILAIRFVFHNARY